MLCSINHRSRGTKAMTKQQTWWDTDPTWWTVTATVTDLDGTNPRKVQDRYYGTRPDSIGYLVRHIDRTNTNYYIEKVTAKNK
jgi:hypothetical protein